MTPDLIMRRKELRKRAALVLKHVEEWDDYLQAYLMEIDVEVERKMQEASRKLELIKKAKRLTPREKEYVSYLQLQIIELENLLNKQQEVINDFFKVE